ncbi:hypothetical protein KKC17_00255 [Patescibacteria group bacterium]|nr:hypothetical protein [Patescibacteria group bacterium]
MKLPDYLTKPLKLKIKPDKLLPWLPSLTLVILLFLLIVLIVFLQRNFYQTLAQVQEVNLLRSQVTQYRINVPLYEKVLLNWQNKKTELPKPANPIPNPFSLNKQTAEDITEIDKDTALDNSSTGVIKSLP